MENNKYIIISFNTTTDAMAFEKFCLENNYKGKLISVPKEIESGCGLAWEIKINYDEVNNANTDIDNKELNEITLLKAIFRVIGQFKLVLYLAKSIANTRVVEYISKFVEYFFKFELCKSKFSILEFSHAQL